jgi:hypothetical protein
MPQLPQLPDLNGYIDLALANLPLTLLAASLVFALLLLAVLPKPHTGVRIMDALFGSYLFFAICLLFLHQAVLRGIFGPEAIATIRGTALPVDQADAYASLAFAVIAFLALSHSTGLRIAAVVGPAIYMLGPLATQPLTQATVEANAPQLAIVLYGILLLPLQAGVGRARTTTSHGSAPPMMAAPAE